jgi:hypothetical protein
MTDDTAKIFAFILWFVIVILGFYKKLRDNKTLLILHFITFVVAIYAIVLKTEGQPFTGRFRNSDFLFAPFIYVFIYGLLRMLYKDMYQREPTYNRSSWYDEEEGRNQNIFDVIVFIFPLLFSLLSPVLLNQFWSK